MNENAVVGKIALAISQSGVLASVLGLIEIYYGVICIFLTVLFGILSWRQKDTANKISQKKLELDESKNIDSYIDKLDDQRKLELLSKLKGNNMPAKIKIDPAQQRSETEADTETPEQSEPQTNETEDKE